MFGIFIALILLALNLLAFFIAKSRVNAVIFTALANLIVILLYSIKISDFFTFRELVIATLINLMSILLLFNKGDDYDEFVAKFVANKFLVIGAVLICTTLSAYLMVNISNNLLVKKDDNIIAQTKISLDRVNNDKISPHQYRRFNDHKHLRSV